MVQSLRKSLRLSSQVKNGFFGMAHLTFVTWDPWKEPHCLSIVHEIDHFDIKYDLSDPMLNGTYGLGLKGT